MKGTGGGHHKAVEPLIWWEFPSVAQEIAHSGRLFKAFFRYETHVTPLCDPSFRNDAVCGGALLLSVDQGAQVRITHFLRRLRVLAQPRHKANVEFPDCTVVQYLELIF